MFPEILITSFIITIIAKKVKDYYSNRPSCARDDAISDRVIETNNIVDIVDISNNSNIQPQEEILVIFYSDKNYMGDKKELVKKIYSKDDIGLVINSIKIITKKSHVIFYNGESRVFSYTSHIPNTIEYIKSGKLWTHVQVTKF